MQLNESDYKIDYTNKTHSIQILHGRYADPKLPEDNVVRIPNNIFYLNFPSKEFQEVISKLVMVKEINYYIGKGGYYYDKLINSFPNKPLNKLDHTKREWKNHWKAVVNYLDAKSEYYHDVLFKYKDMYHRATIRISNHPAQQIPSPSQGVMISIVIPDKGQKPFNYTDFNLNEHGLHQEIIAGKDFPFDGDCLKLAGSLKRLINFAQQDGHCFSMESLLSLLNNVPQITKKKTIIMDDRRKLTISKILNIPYESVTKDYIDIYEQVKEHKDDIIKNGNMSSIPEYETSSKKRIYKALLTGMLSDDEKEIFKQNNPSNRKVGQRSLNKSSNVELFNYLIKYYIEHEDYKDETVSIRELTQYLMKNGWKTDSTMNANCVLCKKLLGLYNENNPDNKFILKTRFSLKEVFVEFEKIILEFIGDTEGTYTYSMEDWLSFMKDSGLSLTETQFLKLYGLLKEKYPDLILIQNKNEERKNKLDDIKQVIIDIAKTGNTKTYKAWCDFLNNSYGYKLNQSAVTKLIKDLQTENPDIKFVEIPMLQQARDYIDAHKNIIPWKNVDIMKELNANKIYIDMGDLSKMMKKIRLSVTAEENYKGQLYNMIMEQLSKMVIEHML